MCGRYVSVRSDADLLATFDAIDATDDEAPEPDYNVAPTKPVRAVVNRARRDDDGRPTGPPVRQLRVMSWGLVPSWAKDRKGAGKLINARAETLATSSAFRRAYAARRCLIPADGWYEWQRGPDGHKQAMYMTPTDGHPLAFAGLYEFWGKGGELLTTCTIVTAAATGVLETVHDRMPLVLARPSWTRWLDTTNDDPRELLGAWDEASGEHLELRPVASTVNNVANNGPELIALASPEPQPQQLF